ncbi:LuxR family transcriptional regulator [Streptomyces sp. NPDC004542]|uniref:helix-turn-helix transcriptional regulator n=1 Tax=Streptomyces sp. NPDC004542 TaxID=3154281 RepID=UPI0033A3D865
MTTVDTSTAGSVLERTLTECLGGEFRTVLAEGPAGCGKSTLVDSVFERASAAGAVVLTAVGTPAERDLPLGVLRQLAQGAPSLAQPAPADAAAPRVEDMQAFGARVRELSAATPVVLSVDDVQHADTPSLECLQYLARELRTARVLLLFTSTGGYEEHAHAAFATELLRRPHVRRVRLGRLSLTEIAAAAKGVELGARLYEITGGNPLLLRSAQAELEDRADRADRSPGAARQWNPQPAGPYARAVAACALRSGPAAAAAARACAVLGESATPEHVARLLDAGPSAARQALIALHASGVLDGTRFRHPVARNALLDSLPDGERRSLHRRAAALLRAAGRPAAETAAQLLAAADTAGAPWQASAAETEVLRDAAEDLLARGDAQQAVRLLELAHEVCAEDRTRTAVRIRLAQTTWQFNPAAAERQLTVVLDALGGDSPEAEHVQPLAQLMVLHGRVPAAARLLRPEQGAAQASASPLDTALDTSVAASERLLQSARLTEATAGVITQGLRSLLLSDQPERSLPWSRSLLQEAERRGAAGWSAVFANLHAEGLLRIGDPRDACAFAERALDFLPERTGGTFPYAPLAVLVRARSVMGQYTEASLQADQPVPQQLFDSLHGPVFLRARGRHLLTCHQPHAALADFLEVGRLVRRWGVDRPAFLPWRTDAAEALLLLGEPQQAEQLVLQQLGLPDARRPWVRGLSLRMRAMTHQSAKQRLALLTQAVDELHRSGDRLEAARAMADLGQTVQADGGASAKGSSMIRAAWNIAKECEAGALCKEILPDAPLTEPARSPRETGEPRSETRLSSSEQRVATLAAQGLTNREISAKLYLTVSTVEQHLTRVYRKLQISCRKDLPLDLEPVSQQNA